MNLSSMEKFLKFLFVLKFHKIFFGKFEGYFFKDLEFMELEFHELEYPKRGRLLHIFEIVVD